MKQLKEVMEKREPMLPLFMRECIFSINGGKTAVDSRCSVFGVRHSVNPNTGYRIPNTGEMVMKLRKYLEKRNEVIMAFLFGSWAKGEAGIDSDMDIAVYFKPKTGVLEWEDSKAYYESEDFIWLEIERIVQREVDLLILNRAAATVAESALRGIPIIIKDRHIYMDFLLRITSEAIDFREWVEGYWNLKESRRYGAITRR